MRGNWLRDLAIALAIALAATLLCMVGDAHAQQRIIQISGNNHTAMVTVTIGKSQDVRTDDSFVDVIGRRSGRRRRQSAHRPHAVDPRQEDRHHARVGLCRGQEADRHFRRRGDLRHHPADQRAASAAFPARACRRPRSTAASCCRARCADAATLDKAVTIARQFGPEIINSVVGDVAAAGHAGSALHRDFAHRRPRAGRAVEPFRPAQHRPISATRVPAGEPADHSADHRYPAGEAAAGVLSGASPFGFADRAAWWRAASPPTC